MLMEARYSEEHQKTGPSSKTSSKVVIQVLVQGRKSLILQLKDSLAERKKFFVTGPFVLCRPLMDSVSSTHIK